jgi:nucleoside-diphosphate-sugar epimerase
MKVCVVGGTGNISTSIVRKLLELGHEVVCYNRGQSGPAPEGAEVVVGDRSDRYSFERTLQDRKFDWAIDMICFNRAEAESSLRAFRGVEHFVQCSTVCTYGIDYDWLPVSEDHPLRPITDYGRGKVEADKVFLEAHLREGFPVTLIKPSTTYGPIMGLPRQLGEDPCWIDRILKGKPLLVCGDGFALHQFLHVEDAALCFAHVLGKRHCVGRTYNMMRREHHTWNDYHRTAMKVLGKEVELVGAPLDLLEAREVPCLSLCRTIFAHNCYYDPGRLFRDVPEFQPRVSLEQGMAETIEALRRENRIPDCEESSWEDRLIADLKNLRSPHRNGR